MHDDTNDIREKLLHWISQRRPDSRNPTISDFSAPDAGASNETLLFDLSWEQDGQQYSQALVARLQPTGPGAFPEYDLDQQYKAMEGLANTSVPVPGLAGFEADPTVLGTPFYLMERIDGKVIKENPPYHMEGWFADLPSAQRGEIWRNAIRAIARVSRQDWQALGFSYLNQPELGDTPLQQQIAYYRRFLGWTEDRGRPYPRLHAALQWLEANQPEDEPIALCWGDAKTANLLIDGTDVVGVLDWEMVRLGNPVDDLAWWMTHDDTLSEGLGLLVGTDVPKLDGLPDRAEMISLWEQESGHSAEHIDYYEMLAAFKFGVIIASISLKMTKDGVIPTEMEMDINNTCTTVLERHMKARGIEV